ncbi:MAG TPA: bifunctional phosphoribosyl-AMP cyclohydrolase/phosphoribosyl-ATP diphosphatase HisIE [Cryomorphaceae bacterium]|nr:bifunctional phosphoribosyl-AMP cyclohydrolase/phosphoribosyl-ATP diphosphatase HisIE [Cryomorphaceae bacterium]
MKTIEFDKSPDGLVPAIIQDDLSQKVLMLGYMNAEALEKTRREGRVTFYSRSKKRLWTKGESSGNYLNLRSVDVDCDADALLIRVLPEGPVCHKGTDTCFGDSDAKGFLTKLEDVIATRHAHSSEGSYTSSLFEQGINKVAQKVGEEAVELVIEAKDNNRELFLGEAADLMFHYLVLLRAKDVKLKDVEEELKMRHSNG